MDLQQVIGAVWVVGLIVLVILITVSRRARRHGGAWSAGVMGAMYGWQDRDKQKAIEIVADKKAARRRPETPDEPPAPES